MNRRFLFCGVWLIFLLTTSCSKPVFLYESDPTLLTSTFYVVVKTGSIDDDPNLTGTSNLLGDLLLRGTKSKSRAEFQQAVERLGGSLGVHVSHDVITLIGGVIKENTDAFLDLLEEALLEPRFDPQEFENLKKETLADIAHAKNLNSRLGGLAIRREIFRGTSLERPVIGSQSTVQAITLESLTNRYKQSFFRKNIFFAAATPLEESKIKGHMTKMWKRFPKGTATEQKKATLNLPTKTKLIVVNKPKTATGSILFARAGITANDKDRFNLGIGNFSFGGEPLVSRLFRVVRSELGYTYSIGSTYNALGGLSNQKGLYMIYATPSVEFTSKTLFKTLSMWDGYLKQGLDDRELSLARESLINSYPFEFDSAKKRLGLKADSYLYDVPILEPEEYSSTLKKVSNDTVKEALKKHHSGTGWLISIVADLDVIKKQLETAQKEVPKDNRLVVSEVLTAEQVIQ